MFGYLKRIELTDIQKDLEGYYSDIDNKDFIKMYLEIFKEIEEKEKVNTKNVKKGLSI